ncbi:MAG: co-chaperone YbbN [Rhodospirillales bacterium]|nr:co-chaperone YbbN [Rhodospirillales bacterium]
MDPNARPQPDTAQPLVGGLGPEPTDAPQSGGYSAGGDVITEGTQETFAVDVIEASQNVPVIVDFWAPWCEPCKTLGPALEKYVKNAGGTVRMVKINIDENKELAAQLRIQSIPMVYAFVNGKPADGFQGMVPDSQIKEFVKRLIGDAVPPVEAALEEAAAALEAGEIETASHIYTQVLGSDSENTGGIAGLIRCSVAANDFDVARAIIDGLTPEMLRAPEVSAAIAALDLAETSSAPADVAPLEARLEKNPADHEARYDLAMAYYGAGQNETAIESLLEIIRRDQSWNDDAARLQLLKIFEALGPTHPLSNDGRRQLSSVLFS